MKGFLQQHISYILFYISSITLIIIITVLDLSTKGAHLAAGSIGYMALLSLCLLIGFLGLRYLKEKQNYKTLQNPETEMDSAYFSFAGTSYLFNRFNYIVKQIYIRMNNRLNEKQAEKDHYYTFINQWVHQMKTPLSVISLLLQKTKKDQMPTALLISQLEEESEKLQSGLETVLHSSRLDLFQEDFKVERLSLNDLVRGCISNHKTAFIRNKVFPAMNFPAEYMVESDKKWLALSINQLITNSIKYSAGKGQHVYFYISKEGESLTFSIKDEGIGIPSQDIKRVCQPFFTGQNGRKYAESTGMGLYLASRTLKEIGHTFTIASTEGEGTTASITFTNVTVL
ncbi:sensor histidine kinase [Bacillus sp. 1P06AnD]|uniref:sensor histidine kinase n=1 Tax=Bacillus sp. 1P06AnD TaxID=3132208 RepID=UPI0039A05D70